MVWWPPPTSVMQDCIFASCGRMAVDASVADGCGRTPESHRTDVKTGVARMDDGDPPSVGVGRDQPCGEIASINQTKSVEALATLSAGDLSSLGGLLEQLSAR